MKSRVLVTALVLAASLTVCRGSATEWIKETATLVSATALNAASSVTEAAGSVKDSVTDFVLGPEQEGTEYCTEKGCDILGLSQPKGAGGVAGRSTDSDGEEEDDKDDDLVVAVEYTDDNSAPQKWTVFSTIQDTFTTVKDNIRYHVYKKTSDFTDSIRSMFQEEFSYFLDTLWEKTVGMSSQPDTLFGKFSKAVIDKVMAIGLIVLCLLLSYILWQLYVSILSILALDGTVLLLYKVMGPVWVYSMIWWIAGWIVYIVSLIWAHPYISACVIVGMFVASIVRWVMRLFAARNRAEKEEDMKTTILNLNARLRRMEERQEEILKLLKDSIEREES